MLAGYVMRKAMRVPSVKRSALVMQVRHFLALLMPAPRPIFLFLDTESDTDQIRLCCQLF